MTTSSYRSRPQSPRTLRRILSSVILALAVICGAQPSLSDGAKSFQPGLGRHLLPLRPGEIAGELPLPGAQSEIILGAATLPEARMVPTRSSFLASWKPVPGAFGYRLDVSTDASFGSYVAGYQDLDVGAVTSRIVCHLRSGAKYYYLVRPYGPGAIGTTSEVMEAATAATASGLVINPTFDSSITNSPDAAGMESMINRAIALYQPLFADPVTVEIRFRYATTEPDGNQLPPGAIAESFYVVYYVDWADFITSLKGDTKTTNDASGYQNFPGQALTKYLVPSAASGRAIGLETPPSMFANGTVGPGGPYDGIVTLNSSEPFQFTRPPSSSNYDAQNATEHEIDEILGLGSYLGGAPETTDFLPEDLFSWSAPGVRSHSALGTRYFSVDDGITKIIDFNQNPYGDFGDWLSGPCPAPAFYVQNAFSCKGQFADVTATSPEAIGLDIVGYDLIPALLPPGGLGNISTRAYVGTKDQVMIGGFIVTGTESKQVVLRALGPSLPLGDKLADPFLELHDSSGALIASNDNWRSDQASEIIAAGFAPFNEAESAIIRTLQPAPYTAIVRGANGGVGTGLVEVYDLDEAADSRLANISTRALVQTGDNVLIGGFIVFGDKSSTVVVRAIGPSLTAAGVEDALQDPILELHDSNGALLATNDNWMDGPDQKTITSDGLAPGDSKESALLASLPTGAYTAIVRGVNNTTGVGLVEVYHLD